MVSFTSRPLYPRDRTAVPIEQETGKTQSRSGRIEKRKVFCPWRESSPDHPVSSLVTVPAYRSLMQLSTGSSHSFPYSAPIQKTPFSRKQRTHAVEQNGFPLPRLLHLNDQISTSYVFRTIETFLILPPLPIITTPSFTLP